MSSHCSSFSNIVLGRSQDSSRTVHSPWNSLGLNYTLNKKNSRILCKSVNTVLPFIVMCKMGKYRIFLFWGNPKESLFICHRSNVAYSYSWAQRCSGQKKMNTSFMEISRNCSWAQCVLPSRQQCFDRRLVSNPALFCFQKPSLRFMEVGLHLSCSHFVASVFLVFFPWMWEAEFPPSQNSKTCFYRTARFFSSVLNNHKNTQLQPPTLSVVSHPIPLPPASQVRKF